MKQSLASQPTNKLKSDPTTRQNKISRPKSQASAKQGHSASHDMLTNTASPTPAEQALEASLESTFKSLVTYKQRITSLVQTNADLLLQCEEKDNDDVEVMSAFKKQLDQKDRELALLQNTYDQMRLESDRKLSDLHAHYGKKIMDLQEIILDKESTIRLMEEDVRAGKEFKRIRAGMSQEIESQAALLRDQETKHNELMIRLERKHMEEKVTIQKETNTRIAEVRMQAQQDAANALDITTKETYLENARLVAALNDHIKASTHINQLNEKLSIHNKQLLSDKETNDVIVREKILKTKTYLNLIKELQQKVITLEQTLSHVVHDFDQQKKILHNKANEQISDIKLMAKQLKQSLDYKSQETEHIKRLSLHLISQRSEVETFFMEALDHVRREILTERKLERKRKINHYTQLSRRSISSKDRSSSFAQQDQGKSFGTKQLNTADLPNESIQISDLDWTDKERVLRVLFARMNGIIKDDTTQAHHRLSSQDAIIKAQLLNPLPTPMQTTTQQPLTNVSSSPISNSHSVQSTLVDNNDQQELSKTISP